MSEKPSKGLKRARDADTPEESPKAQLDKKKKLKSADGEAAPAPEVVQEKKKSKREKKREKEAAKEKEEEKGEKPQEKREEKLSKKPIEREITGGIKILDSKIGTGPMAKKGNKVRMRYIGKLTDGKVFDKNVKGQPVMWFFCW